MVNGDDSTRIFVVYRDSNSEPLHAHAHKTRLASMALSSMSARLSAMSTTASVSSPHKHAHHDRSRLRKLVSLRYYSGKVKSWFHREDRDTIVCEDDEEAGACDGPSTAVPAPSVTVPPSVLNNPTSVASAFYASWMEANAAANAAASMATVTPLDCDASSSSEYEPSKEQRWCTNCAKCFQRSLSRYDQFCGLDCRTAHRFRLAA